MSAALERQIADAVVTRLNDATFSQSFTAVRAYRPERSVQEMETLQVIVIPADTLVQGADRINDSHNYQLEIGIFKKIDSDDPDDVDPWLDFVEELADNLRSSGLSSPKASYIAIEKNPLAAEEYLRKHIFASLITITYRVLR